MHPKYFSSFLPKVSVSLQFLFHLKLRPCSHFLFIVFSSFVSRSASLLLHVSSFSIKTLSNSNGHIEDSISHTNPVLFSLFIIICTNFFVSGSHHFASYVIPQMSVLDYVICCNPNEIVKFLHRLHFDVNLNFHSLFCILFSYSQQFFLLALFYYFYFFFIFEFATSVIFITYVVNVISADFDWCCSRSIVPSEE